MHWTLAASNVNFMISTSSFRHPLNLQERFFFTTHNLHFLSKHYSSLRPFQLNLNYSSITNPNVLISLFWFTWQYQKKKILHLECYMSYVTGLIIYSSVVVETLRTNKKPKFWHERWLLWSKIKILFSGNIRKPNLD